MDIHICSPVPGLQGIQNSTQMLPDLTELHGGVVYMLMNSLCSWPVWTLIPAITLRAARLSPTQSSVFKMEAVTVSTSKGMVRIEWINLYKPPRNMTRTQ